MMKRFIVCVFALAASLSFAAPPRDAMPLDTPEWPQNYRLHLEGPAKVKFSDAFTLPLNGAGPHDIAVEHPAKSLPILRVWADGKLVRGPEELPSLVKTSAMDFPDAKLNFGRDFTAMVSFVAEGSGPLFSMTSPTGAQAQGAKALFIHDGLLCYQIDGLGAMSHKKKIAYGRPHTVVLRVSDDTAKLWLDGELLAEKSDFTLPDVAGHIFKMGRGAPIYGGEFTKGSISTVRMWTRDLPDDELKLL